MTLQRHSEGKCASVSVTTSESTTGSFDFTAYSSAILFNPTGSSATTFTFYIYDDIADDHELLAATDGSAVSAAIAAGQCAPIPDECFAAGEIKIVGDATATVHVLPKS